MLFEDAHWADATSLEVLDLAIERMRKLPVLLLLTFRPEFEAPWRACLTSPRSRSRGWSAPGRDAGRARDGRAQNCRPKCWRRSSPRPTACRCLSRS